MRFFKIFFAIFIFSTPLFAQEGRGEWEPIFTEDSDKVYIDVSGLSNFSGEDFYVWSLTEHSVPIIIESISDKIYRTNTYYLFSKRLKKYSILYIICYDENKNVLASFDYGRNSNVEVYQYNYPLMDGSVEKSIYDKCVEVINLANKNN